MTTCSECLTALATMRLSDISPASPVAQHYATCHNCGRIAADLRYAEHRLALGLAEVGPALHPHVVTENALDSSERRRRQRVARWVRGALMSLGGIIIGTYILESREAKTRGGRISTETLTLRCISPGRAAGVAAGYMGSRESMVKAFDGIPTITLQGRASEVAAAVSAIDELDGHAGCPVPGTPVFVEPRPPEVLAPGHAPAPLPPPVTPPVDR